MVTLTAEDAGILTDRVRKLRERLRATSSHVCAERSRLYTEAWRESDGDPLDIRWAKMLARFIAERTIAIRDGELIVGSQSKYPIGASPDLVNDAEPALVLRNQSFTMRGETESGSATEEERLSILQDAEYWIGKSVQCRIRRRWQEILGDRLDHILASRVVVVGRGKTVWMDVLDYQRILDVGLRGLIAEAQEKISALTFSRPDDIERYSFYQAAIIVLESMVSLARRYAALARQMGETESDPARKRELLEIAAVCDRVPEFPATSFREAVQSFWFVYLGAYMDSPAAVGRLDQYLHRFYRQDVEQGRLSRGEAGELLACLWIKMNELTQFQSDYSKELSQGELNHYVAIAGVTPDGRDATNELSSLILDVSRELKLTEPSVALIYHPGLSEDILFQAIETNRAIGGGIPAFLNGTNCVANLTERGISLEDARSVHFSGCVHSFVPGSAMLLTCNLNSHKVFELTLNNGVDSKTGVQFGPNTGDPAAFRTIADLMAAFKSQYLYWVEMLCKMGNIALLTKKEYARSPYHSALRADCMAAGRDALAGGMRNRQWEVTFNLRGLQNIANSMVAIKKLVFEEKKITMDELRQALRTNFQGQEELRQLLHAAPKWGNDDDEVDSVHADLWKWTSEVCERSSLQPWLDTPVMVRRGGATWHYVAGKSCGAFPDGRKAGEPMGDGNVSPVAATDLKGPTAVVNSASKLDQKAVVSNLFNMKFPPHLLKTEENQRKLLALIRTYFERGGYHIQFNMVGKEVLLDAKAHPENYRDLIVRVAGFSAYFVDLVAAVQDDIIARTEHAL